MERMDRGSKQSSPFAAGRSRTVRGAGERAAARDGSGYFDARAPDDVGGVEPARSEIFDSYCDELEPLVGLKTAALVQLEDGVPTVLGWRGRGVRAAEQETAADRALVELGTALPRFDADQYVALIPLTLPSTGVLRFETTKGLTPEVENLLRYTANRLSIALARRQASRRFA